MKKPVKSPVPGAREGNDMFWKGFSLIGVAFLLLAQTTWATHPCTSPLILDLDGNGIHTTSLNYSVKFDINGDGEEDTIGWTAWYSEEAFLWIDLNRNRFVDDGAELFGNNMLLPDGGFAGNGFEALAVFDTESLGGNGERP